MGLPQSINYSNTPSLTSRRDFPHQFLGLRRSTEHRAVNRMSGSEKRQPLTLPGPRFQDSWCRVFGKSP